jgi:hypothetical protein
VAAPQITDVSPAPGALGIALGDQVTVLFDQEMDEESINEGTFILTGPDNDFIFGPDFTPLDQPGIEDEQILNSPYVAGYVEGIVSFQRISVSSTDEISIRDETGAGTLYRTRAIFTPSKPLRPSVQYTAILAGDEVPNDEYDTGARSRTVFDTKKISGTGDLSFVGSYDGEVEAEYRIEITSGGSTGSAEYLWWNQSDQLTTFPGITSTGRRPIDAGVVVVCDPDASFTTGDTFSVVCKPPEVLENNYQWSFTTGSGAIVTPSSSASVTGLDTTTTTAPLAILSITPVERATDLDIDDATEVIVKFNKDLDASTVTNETVLVWSEPVNGDANFQAEGALAKVLSVSGDTLTIQIS